MTQLPSLTQIFSLSKLGFYAKIIWWDCEDGCGLGLWSESAVNVPIPIIAALQADAGRSRQSAQSEQCVPIAHTTGGSAMRPAASLLTIYPS